MLTTGNHDEFEINTNTEHLSDIVSEKKFENHIKGIEKLCNMTKKPSIPVYFEERLFLKSTFD